VLSDDESGKIFAEYRITDETEFAVEFVHSVNKSPVKDIFRVKGKVIQPEETVFSAFGAGMQTDLAPGQTLVQNEDGTMSITGFSQSYNELRYIVGTVSDHILCINNEKINNLAAEQRGVLVLLRRLTQSLIPSKKSQSESSQEVLNSSQRISLRELCGKNAHVLIRVK
jgi:hypothetical protein